MLVLRDRFTASLCCRCAAATVDAPIHSLVLTHGTHLYVVCPVCQRFHPTLPELQKKQLREEKKRQVLVRRRRALNGGSTLDQWTRTIPVPSGSEEPEAERGLVNIHTEEEWAARGVPPVLSEDAVASDVS